MRVPQNRKQRRAKGPFRGTPIYSRFDDSLPSVMRDAPPKRTTMINWLLDNCTPGFLAFLLAACIVSLGLAVAIAAMELGWL
jgi:hypothetical protein